MTGFRLTATREALGLLPEDFDFWAREHRLSPEYKAALAEVGRAEQAIEAATRALREITELPGYPLPHKAIAHNALAALRVLPVADEDKRGDTA